MELTALGAPAGDSHLYAERELHTGDEHYGDHFVRSFSSWLQRFGRNKGSLLSKTFIDEHGVRRHIDNWAKFEGFSDGKLHALTGCMNVPVSVTTIATNGRGDEEHVVVVYFLTNFRKLWDYFGQDTTDEVSKYAPLFKLYVYLYFHRRTSQLVLAIGLYHVACLVVIDIIYPVYSPVSRFINFFAVVLQVAVYMAIMVLFRGAMFPDDTPRRSSPDETDKKDHPTLDSSRPLQTLDCWYYLKAASVRSTQEVRALLENTQPQQRSRGNNKQATPSTVPFYTAINIALKFISKHGRTTEIKLDLVTRWHNVKLLFVFFIIPIVTIIGIYASPTSAYSAYREVCRVAGENSDYCHNFTMLFIWSLAFTLPLLLKIIFISAVLMALIAMGIGAEVARALVDLWISRFGCLRILDAEGNEITGGHRTRPDGGRQQDDIESGAAAVVSALHAPCHTSGPGSAPRAAAAAAAPIEADRAESVATEAITSGSNAVSRADALTLVQRDAYESYLFLREYMSTASKVWSFTILNFVFLAAFFTTVFLAEAIVTVNTSANTSALLWAYYACWTSVRVVLLTVCPITALAHANAYIYALQELFLVAAPEDFAVLGGRDNWLDYLEKVPAVWTVYGIAVSWDRLSGLLWGGVATIGALALSAVFGSN
jgi:hypothetical protein